MYMCIYIHTRCGIETSSPISFTVLYFYLKTTYIGIYTRIHSFYLTTVQHNLQSHTHFIYMYIFRMCIDIFLNKIIYLYDF